MTFPDWDSPEETMAWRKWYLEIGSKIPTRQTLEKYVTIRLETKHTEERTVEMGASWLALAALRQVSE